MDVDFNKRKCGKFFFSTFLHRQVVLLHKNSMILYLVLVGGFGLLGVEEKKSFDIYKYFSCSGLKRSSELTTRKTKNKVISNC